MTTTNVQSIKRWLALLVTVTAVFKKTLIVHGEIGGNKSFVVFPIANVHRSELLSPERQFAKQEKGTDNYTYLISG